MPIYVADKEIKSIFMADKPVYKVYIGDRLLWKTQWTPPTEPGDTVIQNGTNGNILYDYADRHHFDVSWRQNSRNTTKNTSNVTVTLEIRVERKGAAINLNKFVPGFLSIDGIEYPFEFFLQVNANSTKVVATQTVDIWHDSNRTKSLPIKAYMTVDGNLAGNYFSHLESERTVQLMNT